MLLETALLHQKFGQIYRLNGHKSRAMHCLKIGSCSYPKDWNWALETTGDLACQGELWCCFYSLQHKELCSGIVTRNEERDALLVIKKLQKDFKDRSEIIAYILNAKRLKEISFVLRTGNVVALTLATEGLNEWTSTYMCNGLSAAVLWAATDDCRVRTGIG